MPHGRGGLLVHVLRDAAQRLARRTLVTIRWAGLALAIACAVEAQQAICVYNLRPDAIAPLAVRMGLSVGDVSWDAGECFGTPAVEAARLVAMAEGAQIVCSDFVRVMARGRGGHRFSPLGALALKGLPEPVEAAQVEWEPPEHLAADRLAFPRSLVVRSPLVFVGRDEELATAERHPALGRAGGERRRPPSRDCLQPGWLGGYGRALRCAGRAPCGSAT